MSPVHVVSLMKCCIIFLFEQLQTYLCPAPVYKCLWQIVVPKCVPIIIIHCGDKALDQ